MSIRRDGSFIRSQRLLEIAKMVAKEITASNSRQCSYDLILNRIMLNVGLTEKRASEYICVVCHARGWQIKDGFIVPGEI